jgi:hypothetical protein
MTFRRAFDKNPNPLRGFSQDLLKLRSPSKIRPGRVLRGTSQTEKVLRKSPQKVRVLAMGSS